MSVLDDQRMHLWARALPLEERPARGYSACGVHIGRFTQKIEDVDCSECLVAIAIKRESNE